MILFRPKSSPILPVPGNGGHNYETSYGGRSRCSHICREQTAFLARHSLCAQFSRERREQISKLRAYLFPLFPGTGKDV